MAATKVAVLGGAGYVGGELVRLLHPHPAVELAAVSSRSHAGRPLGSIWPQFRQATDLCFSSAPFGDAAAAARVVFLAMGQGDALELVPALLAQGKIVIDTGPDYRFRATRIYEEWYGRVHAFPAVAARAAYGLTELFRTEIRQADLVANPGCYPTAVILALAPLLQARAIDPEGIAVTALSGLSGAGRQPAEGYQFAEAAANCRAYGLPAHRHVPEIEQGLAFFAGQPLTMTFVPHLVPMARGLFVTATARAMNHATTPDVVGILRAFYEGEPFVTVLAEDTLPETKAVLGTNHVQLTARVDGRTGRIITLAVLDNLVKGAAGQAVQNMNLLLDLPEETGLTATAIYP